MVEQALRENMPYDQFAKALITASGSTMSNPPANFYRTATDTNDCVETISQVFLGARDCSARNAITILSSAGRKITITAWARSLIVSNARKRKGLGDVCLHVGQRRCDTTANWTSHEALVAAGG